MAFLASTYSRVCMTIASSELGIKRTGLVWFNCSNRLHTDKEYENNRNYKKNNILLIISLSEMYVTFAYEAEDFSSVLRTF